MEQEELVDCDPGEYIILSDQISLLETLIQNVIKPIICKIN